MGSGKREKKWKERVKNVEKLASWYEKKPLCSPYRPKLSKPWQPSPVWKLFHRQAEAFNFAKTCKEDVHVFAMEKNATDKKRFYLVTTYIELWFYYKKHLGTSLMNSYEVIPEGAVCKLYFDLEFYIPTNPRADGKQMVANLIEFVCEKLEEHYGVKCSTENVLNLDSSTEKKFSCHLIFQLDNVAFKNNIHIGNFVRMILQPAILLIKNKDAMVPEKQVSSDISQRYKITTELPTCIENQTVTQDVSQSWQQNSHRILQRKTSQWKGNPDLSFLIVNGKQGEKQLFVDLGVYTKNRNFRLYKSSKAGDCTILDIAEDNKFVPKPVKNTCTEQQYFFSSLICNIRFSDSLKMICCDNPEKTMGKSVYLDGRASGLCLDPIEGYQCSPYPEIDNFVVSLVSKDNIQGGIRRWNYFSFEQLLVYDIFNYRWCWNIGRAHKSNNIMIVVDLKKEIWYQKCHDPVCRAENFRSECFPLPAEICLPFLFKEDEEYVYTMDEYGNIEEKASRHYPEDLADDALSLTAAQANRKLNMSSSVSWDEIDDLCFLEATEDVELAEAADSFQFQGNDEIDDLCFLEASEAVELAEAAASFQLQGNWIGNEIPDELLAEALRKHRLDEITE